MDAETGNTVQKLEGETRDFQNKTDGDISKLSHSRSSPVESPGHSSPQSVLTSQRSRPARVPSALLLTHSANAAPITAPSVRRELQPHRLCQATNERVNHNLPLVSLSRACTTLNVKKSERMR